MKHLKIARRFVFFGLSVVVFLLTFVFYHNFPNYVAKTADATETGFVATSAPESMARVAFPIITAQGVYAYDLDSREVLYEKDADRLLLPASTTKIVTALVALDNYDLGEVINTGQFGASGSSMGLTWNEQIVVRELMYGLLIHSGNDAAEVLAASHSGGREAFIDEMNEKAKALGAYNTHFVNPSGLDEAGQITTARDLAKIAEAAMGVFEFAKIVGTEKYTARDVTGATLHYLTNRNELLGEVPGVMGVKTGWTEGARENLVTLVERDGKRVMIVLLGSQDRFGETKELIEWIYSEP